MAAATYMDNNMTPKEPTIIKYNANENEVIQLKEMFENLERV